MPIIWVRDCGLWVVWLLIPLALILLWLLDGGALGSRVVLLVVVDFLDDGALAGLVLEGAGAP